MSKVKGKKYVGVHLEMQDYNNLKIMAKQESRSISGQIRDLIREAAKQNAA